MNREPSCAGPDDRPRSLRDADVRERRRGLLGMPHIAPLTAYASRLRERGLGQVPEFDPFDGGIEAQALFLFEKPGPMTAESGRRTGSGFISRNNDDPTAEAVFSFMRQAGIPRELTIIWNVVPWWNNTVKVTRNEMRDGVMCLPELISLLPKLRAVAMVGRKAASARPCLETTQMELFNSCHPSPRVRARWPDRWNAIPSEWARVRECIDLSEAD